MCSGSPAMSWCRSSRSRRSTAARPGTRHGGIRPTSGRSPWRSTARSTSTSTSAASCARATAAGPGSRRSISRAMFHQVLAHPSRAEVRAGRGGRRIRREPRRRRLVRFITEGMHAHYLRAVAADGRYCVRSRLDRSGRAPRRALIARARRGRPRSSAAVTACRPGSATTSTPAVSPRPAASSRAAPRKERVFRSLDGGQRWDVAAKGLPPVTCVPCDDPEHDRRSSR